MKGPVVLIPVLAGLLSLVSTGSAGAGVACQEAVLRDWSDGRIDRTYPVECYRATLRGLPEDLRVYSSAEDDINRALRARITAPAPKKSGRQLSSRSAAAPAKQPSATPSDTEVAAPIPLLALAGVAIVFLAGTSARLARNLRASRRRP